MSDTPMPPSDRLCAEKMPSEPGTVRFTPYHNGVEQEWVWKGDYDALASFARSALTRAETAEKNEAAIRELMNVYNLGGWTDAIGPMKRALAAEQRLASLESARDGEGWCIRHVDGRWRTLDSMGMPDFTDDQADALCFSLRKHADLFAGDDPEDVRIVPAALAAAGKVKT